MLRWGILATGMIAHKFATTVSRMPAQEAVLAACASRSADRAQHFAGEFSIPRAYGSYEELAQDPDVDIVYIATPNNLHAEHIRLCLNCGKHVLCEKPFTLDAVSARELYACAARKNLFLMEGLWTYHLPLIRTAQQLLQAGAIGEPVFLRAEYGFSATGPRRERKFQSALGGGSLLDIGIYGLAFADQMLGGPLQDFSGQMLFNEYGTDWFEHLSAVTARGQRAALTTSIGLVLPKEGVLYGSEGRLYFPDYQEAQQMTLFSNSGTEKHYSLPFDYTGFEYEIREADRCIHAGKTQSSVYPPEASIRHMEELDAIRRQFGLRFAAEQPGAGPVPNR
jgi:predicted dehydrogenase